ncbi:response regulator transcription factor [Saccharibacillus sp. CPCC 101409]|uniref:response regulator transcription factor n=1 Tax=Saccharibacillus sp. CPCC 101409 TaxID=3058041 RepID=UPI002672753D|nr:response regulator transcription factor [Saccharibacillus sp. CPCC 101409]MDO3410296.1 response regulator transcription factor [Saccharibacillus sp. CPCC 101409]
MTAILVVEDDESLNTGIALTLGGEDVRIVQAYNLAQARRELEYGKIDLIVLDVNLPDGSGLEFCASLRRSYRVPVVFLTANDLESDIVTGLALGGDDYITKPFSLMVLRARVSAVLRRTRPGSGTDSGEKLTFGSLTLDFGGMEYVKKDSKITLSRTEQKLLKVLVENRGRILTRERLLEHVWSGEADFVDENALSVCVKRLRAKIEDDPAAPRWIKTAYGLGYTWAMEER